MTQVRIVAPARPEAVPGVRRQLAEAVQAWRPRLAGDAVDTLLLVVSELVTNAVVHAPGAPVTVCLTRAGGRVRMEVGDGSSAVPAAPRSPSADAECGRGLLLVAAFAVGFGVDPTPRGKRVWAELALPSAAASAAGSATGSAATGGRPGLVSAGC